MKNTIQFAMLAIVGAMMCGCASFHATAYNGENGGYSISQQDMPMKDYKSLGLVFTTLSYEIDEDHSLLPDKSVVALDLLKKAHAIGADDIINVRIVRKAEVKEGNSTSMINILSGNFKGKIEYDASALAIKYTGAIIPNDMGIVIDGNYQAEGCKREHDGLKFPPAKK